MKGAKCKSIIFLVMFLVNASTIASAQEQQKNITLKKQEYFNEGQKYFKEEKYEKAIEYYKKVLEIDPNHKLSKNNIDRAKEKIVLKEKKEIKIPRRFNKIYLLMTKHNFSKYEKDFENENRFPLASRSEKVVPNKINWVDISFSSRNTSYTIDVVSSFQKKASNKKIYLGFSKLKTITFIKGVGKGRDNLYSLPNNLDKDLYLTTIVVGLDFNTSRLRSGQYYDICFDEIKNTFGQPIKKEGGMYSKYALWEDNKTKLILEYSGYSSAGDFPVRIYIIDKEGAKYGEAKNKLKTLEYEKQMGY